MSDGALTRSALYNPPVQHFSGSALARFRRPLLCQPYFCPRCPTAPEAVLLVPIVGAYPPKIRADSRAIRVQTRSFRADACVRFSDRVTSNRPASIPAD